MLILSERLLDLIFLFPGQLVTVSRWQVRGGLAVPGTPDRRVAFADSGAAEAEVGRQLTGLEQEMAGLTRLRHPNILAYIGLVREATRPGTQFSLFWIRLNS